MHLNPLPLAVAAASLLLGANAAADLGNATAAQWTATGQVILGSACGGIGGGCFKNANDNLNFLFTVTTQPDCVGLTLTEWRSVYPLDGVDMVAAAIGAETALVNDPTKTPIAHIVVLLGPAVGQAATQLAAWGTQAGVTFNPLTNCGTAGLLYAMMNDEQASKARTNTAFTMVMPVPDKMKLFRSFEEFGPNGAALSVQSSGLDITLAGGAGDLKDAAARIETALSATKAANPSMSISVADATKIISVKGIKPADLLVAATAVSSEREIAVVRPSRAFDTSNVAKNDGSVGVIVGGTIATLLVVGGAFFYGHRRKHQMLDQYRNQYEEYQRASQAAQGKGKAGGGGGRGGPQRPGPQQRQAQGGRGGPQTRTGPGQGSAQSMRPGGAPPPQSVRGGNGGKGRGPPRKMPSGKSSKGKMSNGSGQRLSL